MRITPVPLLLLAALAASPAAAERAVSVAEVRVEGCRQVHPDRVRFVTIVRSGARLGERELPVAIADDVKAIERMGPFTGVQSEMRWNADQSQVTIVYRVTELPYVVRIDWSGIPDEAWSETDDLERKLGTKVGGYANPLILDNDLRLVERHFRDRGHRSARATVATRDEPGGTVLAFGLELGPEVKVGRVVYRGLPDGMRRRRFDELLEKTQVNRPGRPYQPELMPLDQGDVIRTLQDEGWLDARLRGVEVELMDYVRPLEERKRGGPDTAPDGQYDDRAHIVYDMDAGARYRLGEVSFVGNTVAGGEALRAAFGLEAGVWFRRADIGKAVERARRVISNQGYARCRFIPDRRIDLASRTVHLVLRVEEGRQYRIGRIDVRGNQMTRDSVVRRAITLGPGDLWNDDAVDESKRQVLRSGLFRDDPRRPFRIGPEFPEDRPDQADLVVRLEEESSGSLQAQLGYSSATGIFGQFGYTERNFDLVGALTDPANRWRGGGQILDLNAQWSPDRNSFGISWTEPALGDGPFSNSESITRSDSRQRDWDEVRLGFGSSLGRGFVKNDLRLTLGYSYTDIRVTEVDLDAPDDAATGYYYYNNLGLTLSYDRLDNVRLPTRGVLLSANQNASGWGLGASDPWREYSLKADGFLPLLESEDGGVTFLHASARWRQAAPLGDGPLPFYQRYLGGGPAPRHRGFAFNDLGPTAVNANGYESRIGGDRDLVATLELSYPVQGLNDGVRVVLFTDVGNVWGVNDDYADHQLRTAYGFGLRFPMQFPISLDFAFLADARDDEASSQVHFGLGQVRF